MGNSYILLPHNKMRVFFDLNILWFLLLSNFYFILNTASGLTFLSNTRVTEFIIDLYFLTEIILNFFTGFFLDHGVIETRFNKVMLNYIKKDFFFHFLSTIPCLIYLEPNSYLYYFKSIRILRQMMGQQSKSIKQTLDMYFGHSSSFRFRMQNFVHLMIVFIDAIFYIHLIACLWLYIQHLSQQNHDDKTHWADSIPEYQKE